MRHIQNSHAIVNYSPIRSNVLEMVRDKGLSIHYILKFLRGQIF
jgi:hypothetical protein